MNDLINNIIKRYEAFKGGDRSATADVDVLYAITAPPSVYKTDERSKQIHEPRRENESGRRTSLADRFRL